MAREMGRCWTPTAVTVFVLAVALLCWVPPAQASLEYLGHFGSGEEGVGQGFSVSGGVYADGYGQVDVFTAGGGFQEAFGWGVADGKEELEHCAGSCKEGIESQEAGSLDGSVAVSGGTLYTLPGNNERIDEFTTSGVFLRGFGWGVNEGNNEFEICTKATKCHEGTAGEEVGHFDKVGAFADSGGLLYFMRDDRIERWDGAISDGAEGWGIQGGNSLESCSKNCLQGVPGSAAGQLEGATGMAVGDGDLVIVDAAQARVNVFHAGGGFIDAFGWGVADGKEEFEVCSVTCLRGKEGYGAGELSYPVGVTIEGSDAYVVDRGARRIDEYDLSNSSFVAGYGYGVIDHELKWEECTTATGCVQGGFGPEDILQKPEGIGSDGSGILYVGEPEGLENAVWIDRFAIKGSGSGGGGGGGGSGSGGSGSGGGGGSGGSSSGGSGSSHLFTPTELIAAIARYLSPAGAASKIGALLHKGGLVETVSAPEAGSEVVAWYEVPHGAHLAAKPKPVLIASGSAHFAAAGDSQLKVALTRTGKALLKRSHRLTLTAWATFTPSGGSPVRATRTFAIHR